MKNFKEIAEKVLKKELSGTFILKNGSKRSSNQLIYVIDDHFQLGLFLYDCEANCLGCSVFDIIDFIPDMETRNVKLTLEKAKEWYKKGGELKEVALQAYSEKELQDRPTSWEDYCKNYSLTTGTGLQFNRPFSDKDAQGLMALSKIIRLRKAWIGDWKPNWKDCSIRKYCITKSTIKPIYTTYDVSTMYRILSFPTREMAEDFLNTFKDILDEASLLYE